MGDETTKRVPVPAGGAPIPSALDAADATPPAAGACTPEAGDGLSDEHTNEELVEARALLAFGDYKANDLVRAPADEIDRMKLAGQVDPHEDAVAHIKRA